MSDLATILKSREAPAIPKGTRACPRCIHIPADDCDLCEGSSRVWIRYAPYREGEGPPNIFHDLP